MAFVLHLNFSIILQNMNGLLLKLSSNMFHNIVHNIENIQRSKQSQQFLDILFQLHINKRNLCLNNQYEPYCYIEHLPKIEKIKNLSQQLMDDMIKYNNYIFNNYYKSSYFYEPEQDENNNYLIFKEHFAPFRKDMFNNTTKTKWSLNQSLEKSINFINSILLNELQILNQNIEYTPVYILLSQEKNNDNIVIKSKLTFFIIHDEQELAVLSTLNTGDTYVINNKNTKLIEEYVSNDNETKVIFEFNIQDYYNYTDFIDNTEPLFISTIIQKLNQNNAFLDYILNMFLSIKLLSNSFNDLQNMINNSKYHKKYLYQENDLIVNIYPELTTIYPFIRNYGFSEHLDIAQNLKNKILDFKQPEFEKEENKNLSVSFFDKVVKFINIFSSNKKQIKESSGLLIDLNIKKQTLPIQEIVYNSSLLEIVSKNKYECYFSEDDLHKIEFIHKNIQDINDNELQLLYQTFLNQVQKYINLDEMYAIQYDFSKHINILKEKIIHYNQFRNKSIIDQLNSEFDIMSKL